MRKLVYISIFFVSEALFAASCPTRISLDSHIHNTANEIENVESDLRSFLDNSCADYSFLISGSYGVYDSELERPKEGIEKMDRLTSDLVKLHPNRLLGLCGISSESEHSMSQFPLCLSMPGMVGLKVRLGEYHLEQPVVGFFNKLYETLKETEKKPAIILAHLPHGTTYRRLPGRPYYTEREEINYTHVLHLAMDGVLAIAESFSDTQVVIAHSLYDPREVRYIADKVVEGKLKNVWIETSTSLTSNFPFDAKEPNGENTYDAFVRSWKYFGLDRILFGSDSLLGRIEESAYWMFTEEYQLKDALKNFREQASKIKDLKNLTAEEKAQIFKVNGKVLIKKVLKAAH